MSLLALSGITKNFGEGNVLKGISLEVGEGELLAILGSSGAGKSTLLRLIAGFEKPDQGEITFDGQLVAGDSFLPAEKRKIGIVPQDGALFPHLNVYDNIGFGIKRTQTKIPESSSY
jgi:iron(III) transport system ATP-binding protein